MKRITVLFAILIVEIVILADMNILQRYSRIFDFPYGDKAGHFILFGLLNFLITLTFLRALPDQTPKRVALSVGLVLLLLVGLEEFSQKFFPSRSYDLLDLTASYLGLLTGGMTALKIRWLSLLK